MPIDIKLLRTKPDVVRKSQRDRFADETLVDQVLDLDEQWRKSNYKTETLRMEFGKINKEIGDRKKKNKDADCEDLNTKSKEFKPKIAA